MGCGSSSISPDVGPDRKSVQLAAAIRELEKVGAQKGETEALYALFNNLDVSRDGFLQPHEVERLLKLPKPSDTVTASARKRIIDAMDRNKDGEVSFSEFISFVFQSCTYTKHSLIFLGFELLDIDGSGQIDGADVATLLDELVHDPTFQADLIANVDLDGQSPVASPAPAGGRGKGSRFAQKERLNRSRWAKFALKNPAILYPAFRVQEELRSRVLGSDWWMMVTARRDPAVVDACREWTLAMKKDVAYEDGLSKALTKIRSGKVHIKDLAATARVRFVKNEHSKLFGSQRTLRGSVRRMMKQLSKQLSGGIASGKPPRGPIPAPKTTGVKDDMMVATIAAEHSKALEAKSSRQNLEAKSSRPRLVAGSIIGEGSRIYGEKSVEKTSDSNSNSFLVSKSAGSSSFYKAQAAAAGRPGSGQVRARTGSGQSRAGSRSSSVQSHSRPGSGQVHAKAGSGQIPARPASDSDDMIMTVSRR